MAGRVCNEVPRVPFFSILRYVRVPPSPRMPLFSEVDSPTECPSLQRRTLERLTVMPEHHDEVNQYYKELICTIPALFGAETADERRSLLRALVDGAYAQYTTLDTREHRPLGSEHPFPSLTACQRAIDALAEADLMAPRHLQTPLQRVAVAASALKHKFLLRSGRVDTPAAPFQDLVKLLFWSIGKEAEKCGFDETNMTFSTDAYEERIQYLDHLVTTALAGETPAGLVYLLGGSLRPKFHQMVGRMHAIEAAGGASVAHPDHLHAEFICRALEKTFTAHTPHLHELCFNRFLDHLDFGLPYHARSSGPADGQFFEILTWVVLLGRERDLSPFLAHQERLSAVIQTLSRDRREEIWEAYTGYLQGSLSANRQAIMRVIGSLWLPERFA